MQIIKGDLSNTKRHSTERLYASGFIVPALSIRRWSPSTAIIWRFGRSGRI